MVTEGLGVEVRQTVFGFNREGSLGNMVFVRYRIYNKGPRTLNNMYISLWADPDLGQAGDDYVGCDTLEGLGFVYNSDNADPQYPNGIPALGFDFFQGPLVETGDMADTALMWGDTIPGYVNLGMGSFNKYINGTDPDNYQEVYRYMVGLDGKSGQPYVYNNDTLLYQKSGDPVAGTGDLDDSPADRRWMQSTGPITFAPGDSTEILAAVIVGSGANNLSSISIVRELDVFAQQLYEQGFNPPPPPAAPNVEVATRPGRVTMFWDDTSEVSPGEFAFEGYSVWQGEGPTGPWTLLETYDVVNDVTVIQDSVKNPTTNNFEPVTRRVGTNSGLKYYFSTTQDRINNTPLYDLTPYYFRVTAFSFGDTLKNGNVVPLGDRFLESQTRIEVIPRQSVAGTHPSLETLDTVTAVHTGTGDGNVYPLVVDPYLLTGDDYMVTFENTVDGIAWTLRNMTTNTVLVANSLNQSGDDEYQPTEGMVVKVLGPDPGVKDWDIPNGTRRFTWANSSGFGWEGFEGALGWGGPGDIFGFGGYDPVDPLILPNVLLQLAPVTGDGTFDTLEADVSYAYRYIRNKANDPAQPEFAAYYTQGGGSYDFEDFRPSCPLAAYNVQVDPPQRLTVGYLENNATYAVLDGKYWPRYFGDYDPGGPAEGSSATASDGPREWLWIYLDNYSETPNPAYQGNAIDDEMPIMYWATWSRRQDNTTDWADEDEFLIISAKPNSAVDTFTFTAPMPEYTSVGSDLDEITAVPNPFYLYSSYDPSPVSKTVKFHHLPDECTIRIFNLSGDLIRVLEKDDPGNPIMEWDVLTDRGLPVASGIYIYVVEAPGFGEKMGKLAIFTEQEVLQIY
jgi:hypothetical protein